MECNILNETLTGTTWEFLVVGRGLISQQKRCKTSQLGMQSLGYILDRPLQRAVKTNYIQIHALWIFIF